MTQPQHTSTPAAQFLKAVLQLLTPDDGPGDDQQLLQHFPFARVGDVAAPAPRLRIPTTVHGSL
ncbi:MAG: hypothetical protein KF891_21290 [Rhizobacter sp.]|nr:hypothetical protein [Rhizobacter sp.]